MKHNTQAEAAANSTDEQAIAITPEPPYYAVIFTSIRKNDEGYQQIAEKISELAKDQPGYLGVESVRDGLGITVCYWDSLEAMKNWKANELHLTAQQRGREKWYAQYKARIARIERDYEFFSPED